MRNSRSGGMGGGKGEGIWNAGRMYRTVFFSSASAFCLFSENLTHQSLQFIPPSISLPPSHLEPNSPTADSRVQICFGGKSQGKGENESRGRRPNEGEGRKGWIQLKLKPRALVTWWNFQGLVPMVEKFPLHLRFRASQAKRLLIQSEKKLTEFIQGSMGKPMARTVVFKNLYTLSGYAVDLIDSLWENEFHQHNLSWKSEITSGTARKSYARVPRLGSIKNSAVQGPLFSRFLSLSIRSAERSKRSRFFCLIVELVGVFGRIKMALIFRCIYLSRSAFSRAHRQTL